MSFILENHIIGKVYNLTQDNMQAMLLAIEKLQFDCENLNLEIESIYEDMAGESI